MMATKNLAATLMTMTKDQEAVVVLITMKRKPREKAVRVMSVKKTRCMTALPLPVKFV
jgi:hypothetical protein